ncbi:MAG: CHAP domain-containing protein [Myxococcaceae bacterium]
MTRALALCVVLSAARALAVFQCGDTQDTCQCGANNPYPCCDNGGNCTWYAWHNACCSLGVGLPSWGNAKEWTGHARANASYAVQSSPVVNSVSCRDIGTYGHVAFVSSLNGGGNITVREQNCFGGYGSRSYNYSQSYFTGGFITRAGQVQCSPGDSQQQSCGNCGHQSRGCGNDGRWGGWGACSDQGECAPGAEETQSCGDCGQQKRSCSAACRWDSYRACQSAPVAEQPAPRACDTGKLGACSVGQTECRDGVFACVQTGASSMEVCDGVDNDCDGVSDGAAVCGTGALAAPPPSRDDPLGVTHMKLENVGCTSAPTASVVLVALAVLLVRRRRVVFVRT